MMILKTKENKERFRNLNLRQALHLHCSLCQLLGVNKVCNEK